MDKLKPKSVKWPLLSMGLDRYRSAELDPCSILQDEDDFMRAEEERYVRSYACQLVNMRDDVILGGIVKAACEAGIDVLYLMDRQFVLDALREKLERDYYGKY